ncbi:major facilitator superfamily domain-containing protein [Protomyces lactucae-debilis]|uniref:Major facilitator superfamily domain-containing protein n=1 Tax=Protomyces lactucae-debilis TaxID=2754530 RepID=A0A1Y2FH07_PROLT|nr:major facilitator superfamily domain-containing protein [Protomyces lactucae-debilis]ORY83231.1 major facilitator superfamily domain-containing protein [Protomyces lactucae-debilis]
MSVAQSALDTLPEAHDAPPKLPIKDLLILASVRFAEPVSFTSVNPYIFFFILSFGIAEADVGFYAGLIFATFPLAEFATSLFWVRLSDRIGRRKVILICLAGCILPTLLFGFSRSVGEAMLWRTLTGLINGNSPVIATACAELVTYKPHQALAFSVMPVTWTLGSIIGPMLGGSLSDPVQQYPAWFKSDTPLRQFLLKFRFSLPGIVCASLFLVTLIVAVVGLKEPPAAVRPLSQAEEPSERTRLLSRPSDEDNSNNNGRPETTASDSEKAPLTLWQEAKYLTPCIYTNLGLSALVCFVTMSTDQVFPLLASTSRELGGLALASPQVGTIYTGTSVACILGQLLFHVVHRNIGSRGCLRVSSTFCLITCLTFPNMVNLAYLIDKGKPETSTARQQNAILCLAMLCLVTQRIAGILAFPSLVILLTNAVPSVSVPQSDGDHAGAPVRSLLGTVNGLSQATNCAFRGIGPLMMGPFWAWSIRSQHRWVFWTFIAGLGCSIWVITRIGKLEEEEGET